MPEEGPEVTAEIVDIILDCGDVDLVAGFWSALLGRPIEGRRGPYVWLVRPDGGVGFGFQRVSERKDGKNRVHIDVSGTEVRALEARAVALGGTRADGYDAGGFLVMADPEGNEFCIVPAGSVNLDDDGHAHYLEGRDA